jgi:hypothetical protein
MKPVTALLCMICLFVQPGISTDLIIPEKEELIKCSEEIRDALMSNNLDILKEKYMPGFLGINIRGERETLEMILEAYRPGAVVLKIFKIHQQQAEVFGEVGIITGSGYISGYFGNLKFEHNVRFTDIYLFRNGRWRCYRSQTTETQ